MLTVDEVIPMLGNRLDERRIESLFGARGQKSASQLDPAHPEDQRHYYSLPEFGVQFILGGDEVITTIFFHVDGDEDVSPYPWTLRNAVTPTSTRKHVVELFGQPVRSGRADAENDFAPGGWDRFKLPEGLVHFQYAPNGNGISMITAMRAGPASGAPVESDDDPLVATFTPPLVAILFRAEQSYGASLTREQVLAIRDACSCIMLRESIAAATAQQRGYEDLNPELAWEQWQEVRKELKPLGGES